MTDAVYCTVRSDFFAQLVELKFRDYDTNQLAPLKRCLPQRYHQFDAEISTQQC